MDQAGLQPWVVGIILAAGLMFITAIAALISRKAYEHQTALHDQAEAIRVRFVQWSEWLHKADGQRSDASLPGGSLSPKTLTEIAAISDRVRGRALRLQRDWAEATAVLASLDGGVVALDPNSRITLINAAAKKLFQIDRSVLGEPLIQAIRQPEIVESVQQVGRDFSPREISVDIMSDDGIRRSLRIRCSCITYGGIKGLLIAAHDESEARRSDEVRREFVANVSHELKTPLAAIKGYAETVELAIADDPEAAKHFVSQIQEQCKRLESLIADMMTLARAQAGIQHLRPTIVDLDAIIAESIKTYAPVAAARQISLSQAPKHIPSPTVYADREAALTIANNVIGNAIRYTPEGGIVIASSRIEGSFGVLSVQDNGIGIPENEQKRIFERFYRVAKSRKHATTGTGLGLSIVKNLTQSQGGEVRLRSRQGEGSTFEIFLPSQPTAESPVNALQSDDDVADPAFDPSLV
jgi:two-component system phosphate regulon sensor histidine kinase PhoR